MVGYVNLENYSAYIDPEIVGDPWVYVPWTRVTTLSLEHGMRVRYFQRRHKRGWGLPIIEKDLSGLVHYPNRWYAGTIQNVLETYAFIEPDLGPPRVMCMPSVYRGFNFRPYRGQRVMFRAGPSEMEDCRYRQAIDVRTVTAADLPYVWTLNRDRRD